MNIGKYEFRKPWVKYVDIPFEEELYGAIRRAIGQEIAKEIEATMPADESQVASFTAWNAAVAQCADIARGQK